MVINFYKYQGAGNDFVLTDNREKSFPVKIDTIEKICNRRFGVGADGLILLEDSGDADFSMRYFNADGKESTMCGNGGRCIVAFAYKLGLIGTKTIFSASDGLHEATFSEPDKVALKMADVSRVNKMPEGYFVDTGSPHLVRFVTELDKTDVYKEGKQLRYDKKLSQNGLNVNFVSLIDKGKLQIRTYERGVEDETYACGTGSVAAALSATEKEEGLFNEYELKAKGGNLKVSFDKNPDRSFSNIWLTGPAVFVFKGEWEI
jgi:diaminopimelate epimerase